MKPLLRLQIEPNGSPNGFHLVLRELNGDPSAPRQVLVETFMHPDSRFTSDDIRSAIASEMRNLIARMMCYVG